MRREQRFHDSCSQYQRSCASLGTIPSRRRLRYASSKTDATAESPGYICLPVLAELTLVLAAACRYGKRLVASVIRQTLPTAEFLVEDRDTAGAALREFETATADFVDRRVARRNRERGCATTYVFDRNAAYGAKDACELRPNSHDRHLLAP